MGSAILIGLGILTEEAHLFFADVRSPQTVANIRRGSAVEVNIVDPLTRKGYRFKGRAEVHERATHLYAECVETMREAGSSLVDRVKSIVVIEVREARPLSSPIYDDGSVGEADVVRMFRERLAPVRP